MVTYVIRLRYWKIRWATLSDYGMEKKACYIIRLWYGKIMCATLSDYGFKKNIWVT